MQKNENINIIQTNLPDNKNNNVINNKLKENKNINNNMNNKNIIPKHCANFSFSGTLQKNNNLQGLEINILLYNL